MKDPLKRGKYLFCHGHPVCCKDCPPVAEAIALLHVRQEATAISCNGLKPRKLGSELPQTLALTRGYSGTPIFLMFSERSARSPSQARRVCSFDVTHASGHEQFSGPESMLETLGILRIPFAIELSLVSLVERGVARPTPVVLHCIGDQDVGRTGRRLRKVLCPRLGEGVMPECGFASGLGVLLGIVCW